MNWAAGLYAAAIWALAASTWSAFHPRLIPEPGPELTARVARDIVPAIIIGFLVARFG